MRRPTTGSKPRPAKQAKQAKHTITWDQFCEFAKASGRDRTHAFRVFKGERESTTLDAEFVSHFGFSMKDAVLAGRKRASAAA